MQNTVEVELRWFELKGTVKFPGNNLVEVRYSFIIL